MPSPSSSQRVRRNSSSVRGERIIANTTYSRSRRDFLSRNDDDIGNRSGMHTRTSIHGGENEGLSRERRIFRESSSTSCRKLRRGDREILSEEAIRLEAIIDQPCPADGMLQRSSTDVTSLSFVDAHSDEEFLEFTVKFIQEKMVTGIRELHQGDVGFEEFGLDPRCIDLFDWFRVIYFRMKSRRSSSLVSWRRTIAFGLFLIEHMIVKRPQLEMTINNVHRVSLVAIIYASFLADSSSLRFEEVGDIKSSAEDWWSMWTLVSEPWWSATKLRAMVDEFQGLHLSLPPVVVEIRQNLHQQNDTEQGRHLSRKIFSDIPVVGRQSSPLRRFILIDISRKAWETSIASMRSVELLRLQRLVALLSSPHDSRVRTFSPGSNVRISHPHSVSNPQSYFPPFLSTGSRESDRTIVLDPLENLDNISFEYSDIEDDGCSPLSLSRDHDSRFEAGQRLLNWTNSVSLANRIHFEPDDSSEMLWNGIDSLLMSYSSE